MVALSKGDVASGLVRPLEAELDNPLLENAYNSWTVYMIDMM